MKKIAVFASGGGSNALKIIAHFEGSDVGQVVLICTDNANAEILEKVEGMGIETRVFSKEEYRDGAFLVGFMRGKGIDLIVLAGYLKLIPVGLIRAFPRRIVNIHPSLLPKYGGKGMYGINVHRAVIEAGELKSGITIHLVDEIYDHGEVLFQAEVAIEKGWTAEVLQQEVLKLEHLYYSGVIELELRKL